MLGNQTVGGNSTITGNLINNCTNLLTSLSCKNATLTSGTAIGAQSVLNGATIKCLKASGAISLTSDDASITLTGGSTIPIITTGKIIASTGT